MVNNADDADDVPGADAPTGTNGASTGWISRTRWNIHIATGPIVCCLFLGLLYSTDKSIVNIERTLLSFCA